MAYSNYSYSVIGSKECTLNLCPLEAAILDLGVSLFLFLNYTVQVETVGEREANCGHGETP